MNGQLSPAEERERQRRRSRRERILIPAVLLLVAGLTFLEIKVIDLGVELPVANSILVFSLININAILLLLLLFLIARNIVNLLFERRSRVMGARLKTKLVVAFLTLSLVPTGVLFFVTLQFISTSIEYWFNIQLDKSLRDSLHVGRLYYQTSTQEAVSFGQGLAQQIRDRNLLLPERSRMLATFVQFKRAEYRLSSLRVILPDHRTLAEAEEPEDVLAPFRGPAEEAISSAIKKGEPRTEIHSSALGDYVSATVPIVEPKNKRVLAAVVLSRLTQAGLLDKLEAIARGLEGYQQLKMVKGPIKLSHYITLSIVTLLILFGATWFGFRLARTMTVPLQDLAEGTQRIAAGDYNFTIDAKPDDEIGTLIESFNRMTVDLKTSKEELERTNLELLRTNREIEQRRRYMEIVLTNIAAGVISLNAEGVVTTINKSAEQIMGLQAHQVLGRRLRDLMDEDRLKLFESLSAEVDKSGRLERHFRLPVGDQTVSLLLRLANLRDEEDRHLGLVLVIEDLTQIEKAQRMAAWREVARRIAHEVKNPLTPIKLSAQRLQRRFADEVEQREVFEQGVSTIIQQTDTLKSLVDEFSSFARMPAINVALADLNQVLEQVLVFYREAHKQVVFDLVQKTPPPRFYFDADQIKRVLINLLDNALAAVEGQDGGRITVRSHYLAELETARIEVADNGAGIRAEDKQRLFEPYFSTKKQGTGLGLAIVSTIVQDHNGYIRVQDNAPRGTKFIIELPVRGWSTSVEVREHGPNSSGG